MALLGVDLRGEALAAPPGVEVVEPPQGALDGVWAPRRVALVVGIDDYDDPTLGDLRYAHKDARDFEAALSDPKRGDFEVEILGESVERGDFERAFARAAASVQPDDTFLVYFSGHGTLTIDPETRLYLLTSDSELERPRETGLALAELEEAMSMVPARRRVLIVDACHSSTDPTARSSVSEGVLATLVGLKGPPPAPARSLPGSADAWLYAAHYNQPAREDSALENGVYTHFLLKALAGAGDDDGNGLIEVWEAHDWAAAMTIEHTGGLQSPRAEFKTVGREEIYLAGDPARRRAREYSLISLPQAPADSRVEIDGERWKGGGVDPGRAWVELETPDGRALAGRIDLAAGSEVDLVSALERTPQLLLAAGLGATATDPRSGHAAASPLSWELSAWRGTSAWAGGIRFHGGLVPAPTLCDTEGPTLTCPDQLNRLTAGAAWSRPLHGALTLGPSAEVGARWMTGELHGFRISPTATVGLQTRWRHDRWTLLLSPGAELTLVSGGSSLTILPGLSLGLGRWL